ncbi:MAG: UDP-N-acetylmuramoyl-tripeptide--D-alanyl-D-alanine ligase [Bacillota bacterium]|nr:UDP-N-acetylmuramoyl-tripeptide--D-alanyl-D-alanine ligase [Bacillota bacterium]
MEKLTIREIEKAVGGALLFGDPEGAVDSVASDSREVLPGGLFAAIPGERVDGHDFIAAAAAAGCAAALVSREEWKDKERARQAGLAAILTEDTVAALQRLAAWYLDRFSLVKVGVTGSTGKTTTKEMLYHILSRRYRTVRNPGNLNSPVGLSRSIFQIERDTEAAVFEMGMDHLGEIRSLAAMVRPHAAVITNVGLSHIGQLGSRENLLKAKLEITELLGAEDVLAVNWDNDLLSAVSYPGPYHLVKVGQEGPDLRIEDIEDHGEDGLSFTLRTEKEQASFRLGIPGRHNAWNCALAAAAGLACGVSLEEAALGLQELESTDKRLHIIKAGGIKIIDDSYNASPDSVKAALNVLLTVKARRKVAVLADMFELGPETDRLHYQTGRYAGGCADLVLAVGTQGRFIAGGAKDACGALVRHFETRQELEEEIKGLVKEGDAVLVKGSRGMAMDRIVKILEGSMEGHGL